MKATLVAFVLINAKQATEKSYDKIILWCEENLQSEIVRAINCGRRSVDRLFYEPDINLEELKTAMEKLDFQVQVIDMGEQNKVKLEYGKLYNVRLHW